MAFIVYGMLIAAGWTLYGAVWRLYFSPLSKFPGPKIAALTQWYEFYYNIIRPGVFFHEIARMHEIYGMYRQFLSGLQNSEASFPVNKRIQAQL